MRSVLVCAALLGVFACSGSESERSSSGTGGTGSSGTGSSSSGTGGQAGAPNPPACDGGVPAGHHVSPAGTPQGDGTAQSPWDLDTALHNPPAVKPGDTIWLHKGVYAGAFVAKLDGTSAAPVTVRSYPGEWARIDGAGQTDPTLQIYHHDTVFRDFEVMNGDPARTASSRPSGVYVEAAGVKLVNLVVHDTGTGIICNSATDTTPELAPELEVYGCLLYDNGWDAPDRGHGHDLYLQNRDGTKHVLENILFNSFGGFGIHAYSDNDTHWVQGYEITGNVWFNGGAGAAGASKIYDGCLVGHNGTHPVARVTLRENMGYAHPSGERDLRLGWAADNQDATLEDNYLVGQTIFQKAWQSIAMTGNTFFGAPLTGVMQSAYPNNTYLAARPKGAKVFVRPNKYQAGRAHVVVYNWDLADHVDVDLGAALPKGTAFEVRNAQDYFAAPVAAGTYQGGTISLPMKGLSVAQPIGSPTAIDPTELTGPEFNVFVLIGACGG